MQFLSLTFCNISGSPTKKTFYLNPELIVRLVPYEKSTKIVLLNGEELEVVETARHILAELAEID